MNSTTPSGRRSESTRAAILAAARDRFAAEGYERATIRAIAADARIDPAMVMRYFGSKPKLFAAAVEITIGFPDLSTIPRNRLGVAAARFFLDRWEGTDTLIALLRAAATNEPGASDRMREVFTGQVAPMIAEIVPDPAEAPQRAVLIVSQVLGMALARYVLRLPPAVEMQADDIVAAIAPTLQHYLTGPLPVGGEGSRA